MIDFANAHPQLTFTLPKAATVEYFPDPEVESDWLVFRTPSGRPVLYMPVADYAKWTRLAKDGSP